MQNKLRHYMEAKGWGPTELAKQSNLRGARLVKQSIATWRNNPGTYIYPKARRAMAEALGVSEQELFEEDR